MRAGMSILLLGACAAASPAGVIYVDAGAVGAGDGSSWTDAFSDLQDALLAAAPGDDVWVAAGQYVPRNVTNPDVPRGGSFDIPTGVAVYGGFAGDEADFAERAELFDQTILSGDVNGDDGPDFANMDDNVYHVVACAQTVESTRLNGLTIRGGFANGGGPRRQRGAGLIVEDGVVSIEHVTFDGNRLVVTGLNRFLVGGAGACVFSGSATVRESTFRNNWIDCAESSSGPKSSGGAGLANMAADLVVEDCVFDGNMITGAGDRWGGGGLGVFPADRGSLITARVRRCTFVNNSVTCHAGVLFGGGIVVMPYQGSVDFEVEGSVFTSNLVMSEAMWTGNQAPGGGGLGFSAVDEASSADVAIRVLGCEFTENHVENYASPFPVSLGGGIGGGCKASHFTLEVRDTDLTDNEVVYDGPNPGSVGGAGIGVDDSAGEITECTIVNTNVSFNRVRSRDGCEGAGVLLGPALAGSLRIVNCRIVGNEMTLVNNTSVASGEGGGLFAGTAGPIELQNVVIVGNSARRRGGASVRSDQAARGSHVTVAYNYADEEESGIRFVSPDHPVTLENSIVWGNRLGAALDAHGQVAGPVDWLSVNRCDVEGWAGEFAGAGVFSTSPMFANPLGPDGVARSGDEDVHLSAVSTCIDAGDNALVPADSADVDGDMDTAEALPIDADGNPRRLDNRLVADNGLGGAPIVDLGAYEYAQRCPGDVNGDDAVNMGDLGSLLAAFGADAEDAGFDPSVDLRPDGVINVADLGILLTLFGGDCH